MLGIYPAKPPTQSLFHGTPHNLKGPTVLAKMPSFSIADTKTPVVCAGISYLHALAYGFKGLDYYSVIDGQYETPIVIIGTDLKNFKETLLGKKTYIAELAAKDFKEGLFPREPEYNDLPLEWYSRNDVNILKLECLNNAEVLKNGVQLIIADTKNYLDSLAAENSIEQARFCIDSGGEWVNQQYNLGAVPWFTACMTQQTPFKPSLPFS